VNARLVDPAGIVKLVGIVTLAPVTEYPSETASPEAPAALVNETVHCDDPGADTVVGLQLRPARLNVRDMVTVAPDDVVLTAVAVVDAAPEFCIWIVVDEAVVLAANVTAAVATIPLPMTFVFKP
jgi:hypothetical protein